MPHIIRRPPLLPFCSFPKDFLSKPGHVEITNVQMSDHAMSVLSLLLERIENHGILPETEVVCALVKPLVSAAWPGVDEVYPCRPSERQPEQTTALALGPIFPRIDWKRQHDRSREPVLAFLFSHDPVDVYQGVRSI
jgi:hypothetical protein